VGFVDQGRRGWALAAALFAALAVGCGGGSAAPADGGDTGLAPRVSGTLTLPAAAPGKPWAVKLFTAAGRATLTATAETSGTTPDGTSLPYAIAAIPEGTYFVLGFVDVDSSGGMSSTPGDFAGWYGHTGDGNPPATPNAVVPATGSATFDFALVLR
jgi:hypothetical protein